MYSVIYCWTSYEKKTKLYFNISIYLMYIYIKNKIYTYMLATSNPIIYSLTEKFNF